MTVKANLSVILKANDVEVATSEDASLWQQVLLAMTTGRPLAIANEKNQREEGIQSDGDGEGNRERPPRGGSDPLSRMAAALDVELNLLSGACSPQTEAPYITLDVHRYEAMKKALPERGLKAVPNIAIAGTLLGLWFHYANLGNVSKAQAQAVLESLGKRDSNPGRGIDNTEWLQARAGGQFSINPAEISKATNIARCFCTKDWAPYLNGQ